MTKAFIPLESNPQVFTQLGHQLGVPKQFEFYDVYSLDEPDLLAMVPRPVEALIIVFPISDEYDKRQAANVNIVGNTDAIWIPQTIKNACGTYALLHASLNGNLRNSLLPPLKQLAQDLEGASTSDDRVRIVESSSALESAHGSVATQGQTDAPSAQSDDINLHYVCFTYNPTTDTILQLDGRAKGPIDTGVKLDSSSSNHDMLSPEAITLVKEFISSNPDTQSLEFSILALAPSLD